MNRDTTAPSQTEVHTLICKRDLEMGRVCLGSLLEATNNSIRLIVHEDGSLSESDWDALRVALPNAIFVRRVEAESRVEAALHNRPNCRAYRARNPLSNKLLDIPLLSFDSSQTASQHAVLHYIDSDLLFFRRCTGLFASGDAPLFLQEDDQGYSGPLLSLLKYSKQILPSGCNTGLFRLPRPFYDLDFIEWFLGQEELWSAFPTLTEQTCYALLMGTKEAQVISPRQIFCSKDSVCVDEETIAVHFMSFVKTQFGSYVDSATRARAQVTPIMLQLQLAEPLTAAKIVKRKVARTLQRVTG